MELSKQDRAALERLEEDLWREETRFDLKRMNEIIAPDFLEFGRSGRIYRREWFPDMLGCETSGLVLVQKAGYGVGVLSLGSLCQLGTPHEL